MCSRSSRSLAGICHHPQTVRVNVCRCPAELSSCSRQPNAESIVVDRASMCRIRRIQREGMMIPVGDRPSVLFLALLLFWFGFRCFSKNQTTSLMTTAGKGPLPSGVKSLIGIGGRIPLRGRTISRCTRRASTADEEQ